MDYLKNVNFYIRMIREKKILVINFMAKIIMCNHFLQELILFKYFILILLNFHLKKIKKNKYLKLPN